MIKIKLLTLADVQAIVPISRATIWRKMKAGTFPAYVKVADRMIWRESDIQAWLDSLTTVGSGWVPPKPEEPISSEVPKRGRGQPRKV